MALTKVSLDMTSIDPASLGGGASTTFSLVTSVVIPIGSPIYFGPSGWTLAIASSDISSGQYVVSKIAASGSVNLYTAVSVGEVNLTTSQWDVITGSSGGLITGTQYFISSSIAGRISPTPAMLYAPVLKALSPTKAYVSFAITSTESGMGDTFYRDTILTTSNTSTVTLSYPPAGKAYTWLNIDGIAQSGSDFTLAGNTLILGELVPAGTLIDITYARAILLADASAINRMVSFSETVTVSPKSEFNLPSVPSSINSAIVFIGGSIQDPSKFSISGNVLYLADPVPVGSRVVAYILNSSGIANTFDTFVTRQTRLISNNGTSTLSAIFGSQITASYRIFAIEDPRISATILLKHNGTGIDPDVRVDSNSSSVSIIMNTPLKLNFYIAGNLLTIQNLTGLLLNLRIYRET